ncbi:unnamed protein product [Amoebophrya sp. A25]|nr:unnamed protein product [Amoebophrya sp. A25]|eukprot:GSA25T00007981001.1
MLKLSHSKAALLLLLFTFLSCDVTARLEVARRLFGGAPDAIAADEDVWAEDEGSKGASSPNVVAAEGSSSKISFLQTLIRQVLDQEMSTTLMCVILLAVQYFVVYGIYHVLHSYNQLAVEEDGGKRKKSNGKEGAARESGYLYGEDEALDDGDLRIELPSYFANWPDCKRMEDVFRGCTGSVKLCPMLAILFIATRLRAASLSPSGTAAVPGYAQTSMYLCTLAVLGDTLLLLIMPIYFHIRKQRDGLEHEHPFGDDGGGMMDQQQITLNAGGRGSTTQKARASTATSLFGRITQINSGQDEQNKQMKRLSQIASVTRTALTISLYVGFSIVIFALLAMETPDGNRNCPTCPWSWTPEVPASIQCLINLTLQFFGLYLAIFVLQIYRKTMSSMIASGRADAGGGRMGSLQNYMLQDQDVVRAVSVLEHARMASELCPILSVLFIAVRLRANQLKVEPQPWAKNAFYVTTYAVLAQMVLALLQPLILRLNTLAGTVAEAARYICLSCIYVGTGIVVASVFDISYPQAGRTTPPLSSAMRCLVIVLVLYFLLFFVLQCLQSYAELSLKAKTNLQIMLEDGIPCLEMVPMLGVVYVAARFRAMEIGTIDTPSWVDFFMFLSAISLIIQALASALMPYFSGKVLALPPLPLEATTKDRVWYNYESTRLREIGKQINFAKLSALASAYVGVGATLGYIVFTSDNHARLHYLF